MDGFKKKSDLINQEDSSTSSFVESDDEKNIKCDCPLNQDQFSIHSISDYSLDDDQKTFNKSSYMNILKKKSIPYSNSKLGKIKTYEVKKKFYLNECMLSDDHDSDYKACNCSHIHVDAFMTDKLTNRMFSINGMNNGFMKQLNSKKESKKGKIEGKSLRLIPKKSYAIKSALKNTDVTKHISTMNEGNQTINEALKTFETNHHSNINKVCMELDELNIKTKSLTKSSSCSIVNPLIENQIFFFTRISEIIKRFTDLNKFLIFKLNNNLDLDETATNTSNSYIKFEKFEEFMQISEPLTEWLEKFRCKNIKLNPDFTNQFESYKLDEVLDKTSYVLNTSPQIDFEKNLYDIKDQLNSSIPSSKNNGTDDTKDMDSTAEDYDNLIRLLTQELLTLQTRMKYSEKMFNSKKYKVITRRKYDNLKFQLIASKNDYKLEYQEKCHFQKKCLIYENQLNSLAISPSKMNDKNYMKMYDF